MYSTCFIVRGPMSKQTWINPIHQAGNRKKKSFTKSNSCKMDVHDLRSRNWFFMRHMKLGSPVEVPQECWCSSSLFNISHLLFLLSHPEENVKTESQMLCFSASVYFLFTHNHDSFLSASTKAAKPSMVNTESSVSAAATRRRTAERGVQFCFTSSGWLDEQQVCRL